MSGAVPAQADPEDLTETERANLELIRAFRSVPASERKRFLAPGFRRHRSGLRNLGELAGVGYEPSSVPDRRDHVEAIVARGDLVWAVWTVHGTHEGPLFGVEATGRTIEMLELGIWRIEDGAIVEAWFMADELALCRQIGIAIGVGDG